MQFGGSKADVAQDTGQAVFGNSCVCLCWVFMSRGRADLKPCLSSCLVLRRFMFSHISETDLTIWETPHSGYSSDGHCHDGRPRVWRAQGRRGAHGCAHVTRATGRYGEGGRGLRWPRQNQRPHNKFNTAPRLVGHEPVTGADIGSTSGFKRPAQGPLIIFPDAEETGRNRIDGRGRLPPVGGVRLRFS